ncbi:MAG: hypothetical protein IPM48_06190 [Saprospiraceae bacterium]|nr:hypothetical protein [Saprospiraceae bacterium]
MKKLLYLVFALVSCYSFKGTSIDPDVSFFNVAPITDLSGNAPPGYTNDFQEALSNKIRRETRLLLRQNEPDLQFDIQLTQFNISPQAPQAGTFAALNRLTVGFKVKMTNHKNQKQTFEQTFSRFEDFDAGLDFSSEQIRLLNNINKLILEDIFNKAFTNW